MTPTFIDTHGHVQFNAFLNDYKEVIARTHKHGGWIVMPGTQIDTSRRATQVAKEYDEGVYAAIGLHPLHLEETRLDSYELAEKFDRADYEQLLRSSDDVVAIGEIGLDYWRKPKTTARKEAYMQKQKDALVRQLDFASDYDLPVILHCRVAFDDMYEIVKNHAISKRGLPGVIHSFTGKQKDLDNFLGLGYYIAYNALIFTLPHLPEAVEATPIERMVLETDAPYLTPPVLGDARNEPNNALITARHIAQLKNISYENVLEKTTGNARELFDI